MPQHPPTTAPPTVVARGVVKPDSYEHTFPAKRAVTYLRVSTAAQATTSMEGGQYEYMYCLGRHTKRTRCDLPYLSVDTVEALVLGRYETLQVNEVTAERIRHKILDAMKDRTKEAEKLAQRERRRIQRLETDRRKLLQAHLAGAIPLELLKEEQDRIASELANAGGALAATEINWINVENNLKQALGLASTFTTAYDDATPQIRRRINQAVFEKVRIDVDTATVTLTPAFSVLLAEDLLADLDEETQNSDAEVRRRSSNNNKMVEHVGVEPTTSCLQSRRSNQLS